MPFHCRLPTAIRSKLPFADGNVNHGKTTSIVVNDHPNFKLHYFLTFSTQNLHSLFSFFSAGSPDILICGNCREMFNDLVDMMEHKRDYCKLRFTCKCDTLNEDGECLDANCAANTITSQGKANAIRSFTRYI